MSRSLYDKDGIDGPSHRAMGAKFVVDKTREPVYSALISSDFPEQRNNTMTTAEMIDEGLIDKDNGTVTHDGMTLWLRQQAYLAGPHGDAYYTAHAVDASGDRYVVRWEILEGREECEDASDVCDWDDYTVRELR